MEIPNLKIQHVIGEGGMATVYLAEHEILKQKRAVKVLLPTFHNKKGYKEAFFTEGKIVASLDHPNIIKIHDIGDYDGDYCMIMEYLSGGCLKDKLAQEPLPLSISLKILRQTGDALHYAHQHNLLHRDIKPANILFNQKGDAILTDFGISKIQDNKSDLTEAGYNAVGTYRYSSPEQINQENDIDKRCDVYSLALVFYEMITGQSAIKADKTADIIREQTTGPPPILPMPLSFLQVIINKALAKPVEKRYPDVLSFINAVTKAVESEDETVVMEPQPKTKLYIKPKKKQLSQKILMGVGFGSLLLAAAFIFQYVKTKNPVSQTDRYKSATMVKNTPKVIAKAPVTPTPPPIKTTALTINTIPHDSAINIKGIKRNYFDGILLERGKYLVQVSKKGYQPQTRWINLGEANLTETITLPKLPPKTFALTINTNPTTARVRIKNIKPKYNDGIQLKKGKYLIEVSKKGYITQTKWLTIGSADVQESIRLEKNPAIASGTLVDNGDGTISDTKTGLMWKKCSEGQQANTCSGSAKTYTWNDAMKRFKRVSFAGYNNWRLPTKKELKSLVYCSNGTPQKEAWDYTCSGNNDRNGGKYKRPTIRNAVFPNTPSTWYWSSSPGAGYVDGAWIVDFVVGFDGASHKSNSHVRLVRSGQ